MMFMKRVGALGSLSVLSLLIGTAALAGSRPLAVSPGNGEGTVIAAACPSFSWGAVAGATSYELVAYQVPDGLAANASPGALKELWRVTLPGSARSWTPPADQCFTHGGSYAWAVRAVVGSEPGAWSEANLFTIEKAPSAEEVRGTIAGLRRYLATAEGRGQSVAATGKEDASSPRGVEATTRALAVKRGAESKSRDERQMTLRKLAVREKALRAFGDKKSGSSLRSVSKAASTRSLGTPSLSIDANLALGASSNVFKNGSTLLWDDTVGNLALGDAALDSVSGSASENTAVGAHALEKTTGGSPSGYGSENTAMGYQALYSNTTGYRNTAIGKDALKMNAKGYRNTAIGFDALYGSNNGGDNTATGAWSLQSNSGGFRNTATGARALFANSAGAKNTATGFAALYDNWGDGNTATGYRAGFHNSNGAHNIAIGYKAGYNPTAPDDSIFIGNAGSSGDTGTIKIGAQGTQTSTFIAGISNVNVSGAPVLVTSSGQLGVSGASSKRFKKDIRDIGDVSDRLLALRPVSFRYKKSFSSDQRIQYGLVAEEVAKVFPELVVNDKEGRPERVRYELLAPLLLNQLQKEHWTVVEQETELARDQATIEAQQGELQSEGKELAALKRQDSTQQRALGAKMAALESELSRLETRLAAKGSSDTKSRSGGAAASASKLQR